MPPPTRHARRRSATRRPRGMALVLVMIALVVSTILIAGFMSTQGTAIGIARNQRDHDQCWAVAETGVDLCVWLVKNKANWRETMAPGNWLANYPVAGGTVTVSAADGSGAGGFTVDNTHSIIFVSTGSAGGKSFTVQATMTPTGGGQPWSGGTFTTGNMASSNSATVDSYNSAVGPYSSSNHGNNALWWNNSIWTGAVQCYSSNRFGGNITLNPNAGAFAVLAWPGLGPYGTSSALEPRNAGQAIVPNTTGFTAGPDYSLTGSSGLAPNRVCYNSFTLGNSATLTISQNCTFHVTGALAISNSAATLKIDTGASVTIVADGGLSLLGSIQLMSGATLTIYAGNYVDVYGGKINISGSTPGTPASVVIVGQTNCSFMQVEQSSTVSCLVFAPQSDVIIRDSSKFYGSVIGSTLTVRDSAKFRQDQAAANAAFHNVIAGSSMGDYRITWQR